MHDTYLLFYLLKARVTSTATYAIAPLTYVLSCLPCTVLLELIAVTCKVLLDEIFFVIVAAIVYYAVARCLSHAGIVSKQLNISSNYSLPVATSF